MQRSATLRLLQFPIGMLNLACYVVPSGRTFLRRPINLTIGLKKPFHHRRLILEAKADMKAWQIFFAISMEKQSFLLASLSNPHRYIYSQMLVILDLVVFL